MNFLLVKEITPVETVVIDALVYAYIIELNVRNLKNTPYTTNENITNIGIYKDLIEKCVTGCEYSRSQEPRHAGVAKYMNECFIFIDAIANMNVNDMNSTANISPPQLQIDMFYLSIFIKEHVFQNYTREDYALVGSCDIYLCQRYIDKLQMYLFSSVSEYVDIALVKIQEIQTRINEVMSPEFIGRNPSTYEFVIALTENDV